MDLLVGVAAVVRKCCEKVLRKCCESELVAELDPSHKSNPTLCKGDNPRSKHVHFM